MKYSNPDQPLYVDWDDLQTEIIDTASTVTIGPAYRLLAWSTTADERQAVYLLQADGGDEHERIALYTHAIAMAEMQWVSLPAGSRQVSVDGDEFIVSFRVPRAMFSEALHKAKERIGRGRRPVI